MLDPDVEVGVVARFEAQTELARTLGAHRVFAHEPVETLTGNTSQASGPQMDCVRIQAREGPLIGRYRRGTTAATTDRAACSACAKRRSVSMVV